MERWSMLYLGKDPAIDYVIAQAITINFDLQESIEKSYQIICEIYW